MGNVFNDDFREFLSALNKNDVEYVLVGGYSVIIYGYSRTTGDLDILVNRTKENYLKLVAAFKDFKMPVFDMTEQNFLFSNEFDVFKYGRPPLAIDIMNKIKGLNFNDIFREAQIIEIESLQLRVIQFEHLIQAKKAAGRPKDLDDIENLSNNDLPSID